MAPSSLPKDTGESTEVRDAGLWLQSVASELGVSLAEVVDAFGPVITATLRRRRRTLGSLDDVVRALSPSLAEIDHVPRAAVEQARRIAALRIELLERGAYTYRALADGRQATDAATRQFVRRAKQKYQLFTVNYAGETLVPAFLLNEALEPRAELEAIIATLRATGEDNWALWAWFVSPSSWLSGAVPAELVTVDADRVAVAARRRASNAG